MSFKAFKEGFQKNFVDLTEDQQVLFVTDVDKEKMWEVYLDSFPPGTNGIYRERRHHDCSCCRHFIKRFGNVVTIKNNKIVSIWNFDCNDDTYQPVIDALDEFVKSGNISDVFVTKESGFGTDKNRELLDDGSVHTWHHFRIDLPERFVTNSHKSSESIKAQLRDSRNVFKRSLEEISNYAVQTVLDMIAENTLYKGEEWQDVLNKFSELQLEYNALPESQKENYCWSKSVEIGGAMSRIRNHSIGVLLQDITDGMDILEAVRRYENIVAPQNYKRPKPIFTKRMVEDAEAEVKKLGLLNSLPRRFARLGDVTINNVLFADRDAKPIMNGGSGVFESLKRDVAIKPSSFKNVQGIGIDEFVNNVLPNTRSIEILFENKHTANLVSLIAPKNEDSKSLFKWDNGFSWAYTGNITDSAMKQRVKAAGGDVQGVLRFSIQWNNGDNNQNDFDAHCIEPTGNHIYFPNKGSRHRSSGMLDVDIISPGRDVAVENITWSNLSRMPDGEYNFFVRNYSHRGGRTGFTAEIEFDGAIYEYEYPRELQHKEDVKVACVTKSGSTFEIKHYLNESTSSQSVWNINTNQFHRVSLMCYSPNYWNGQSGIGHRHYMFMLADCINDERPNGFFNEYLKEKFMQYKRVFAALGNKMRVEQDSDQLSGLGFSATKRNSLVVRVNNNQVVRIIF